MCGEHEIMAENTKQQVREFYDQIGWSQAGEGLYQNARYEDLRPVVQEYIHKCHLRLNRYLDPTGDLLLDAGSGPVQWPEYLTYSEGYRYRVCADLSITALREARQRLGDKGLYVVMDIAHLPFQSEAFDGVVSLHTIHHLPPEDHRTAYAELYRVLKPGRRGAAVNGWSDALLMRLTGHLAAIIGRGKPKKKSKAAGGQTASKRRGDGTPKGTYVHKSNAEWLRAELEGVLPFEIYPWRSVGTSFTRALISDKAGGRQILRFIYWLEDRFPRFFGEEGKYPIIAFKKQPAR
jgi:SAM-dependent methyltransferase